MSLSTRIFTARKRSLRRLCFYSHSVHGVGGGDCVAGGVCLGPDPGSRLRGLAQGVVYAHTQGEVVGLARGVSRSIPRGQVEGSGQGVSRPGWRLRGLAGGECLGPGPVGRLGF